MIVYKIEMMVVDLEEIGEAQVRDEIENSQYLTICEVKSIESRDIGEWTDGHLLNNTNTDDAEFKRLFTKHET